MRNLIYAVVAAILVFALFYLSGLLSAAESSAPAVVALLAAYYVLAKRSFKRVEVIFTEAGKALQSMPPRLDLAVSTLEKAYALAPEQLGIRSQVDTQIGVIYFLQQDFNKAKPYLERSLSFGHWLGGAMLGVIHYKKKEHAEMRKTFEVVTKRAKKQGLVWCLYAYLLQQIGDDAGAQKVLIDGKKAAAGDEKVGENLLAVQNGKKVKMRGYKEQWYQFHLERPPADQQQQMVFGGRLSKQARRGRW